jgi:hypothetical protein
MGQSRGPPTSLAPLAPSYSARKSNGVHQLDGSAPLNLTYDQYEKEKIVEVLGRIYQRMDYVDTSMGEMLHKIKLMMIRD